MRKVFLIGTQHPNQVIKLGEVDTPASIDLRDRLVELSLTHRIQLLAEEMSAQALRERGGTTTVAALVAESLNTDLLWADPDAAERLKAGIQEQWRVEAYCDQRDYDGAQTKDEIRRLCWQPREHIWLTRLQNKDAWPAIFICGTDHVDSFARLLRENQISVETCPLT